MKNKIMCHNKLLMIIVAVGLVGCAEAPEPPRCNARDVRPLHSTPAPIRAQVSALSESKSYACAGDA